MGRGEERSQLRQRPFVRKMASPQPCKCLQRSLCGAGGVLRETSVSAWCLTPDREGETLQGMRDAYPSRLLWQLPRSQGFLFQAAVNKFLVGINISQAAGRLGFLCVSAARAEDRVSLWYLYSWCGFCPLKLPGTEGLLCLKDPYILLWPGGLCH